MLIVDAPDMIEVSLRPAVERDRLFLRAVYASARADELASVDWSDQAKDAFLDMQFAAQDAYYHEYYADASFDIVELGGQPAGRLYVDRWPTEIRIVDIALIAEQRGKGLGTELLRQLMDEATASCRVLSIHVEVFNPARRLYDRLGFVTVDERGVYVLMNWTAGAAGSREDSLMAHAPRIGTQRDQEQRELAEGAAVDGARLLRDHTAIGGVKGQRERSSAAPSAPLLGRAVPGLDAIGQHEVDPFAGGQLGREHLADALGEGLAGELFEHERQANQPVSSTVRQETP